MNKNIKKAFVCIKEFRASLPELIKTKAIIKTQLARKANINRSTFENKLDTRKKERFYLEELEKIYNVLSDDPKD
jgi:DNA-binding Xre family transcriptional regulator